MGVLTRVLRSLGGEEALERLAALPGSDLTSVLLALMRRRAGALSGPDVLRQYRSDRFVAPTEVPFGVLRAAEDRLLGALPPSFSVLGLAPVAPLGTCSVVAEQDQNNVVSTVRGTEVAADPTNALALEAALRRQTGPDDVRLAAVQRVVRAQLFSGAGRFAHFTLFAAVSAGRDRGSLSFERQHFAEHIAFLRENESLRRPTAAAGPPRPPRGYREKGAKRPASAARPHRGGRACRACGPGAGARPHNREDNPARP